MLAPFVQQKSSKPVPVRERSRQEPAHARARCPCAKAAARIRLRFPGACDGREPSGKLHRVGRFRRAAPRRCLAIQRQLQQRPPSATAAPTALWSPERPHEAASGLPHTFPYAAARSLLTKSDPDFLAGASAAGRRKCRALHDWGQAREAALVPIGFPLRLILLGADLPVLRPGLLGDRGALLRQYRPVEQRYCSEKSYPFRLKDPLPRIATVLDCFSTSSLRNASYLSRGVS